MASKSSGIRDLEKQLRLEGKLPPTPREPLKTLRQEGKLPLRKFDQPIAITPIEYSGLQEAYDHLNKELFAGKLPDVFITYQRKARSLGYFSADRFNGRLDKAGRHELALNPDGFIGQSDKDICSTLVYEQHHVWQHAAGTAPKRGYHDREWVVKMKLNGLQPTSTGMVGGRETGQHMDHLIIPGGRFEQAYDKLAASKWRLNLESALRPGMQKGPSSKTKFTCPKCREQNVWGKPDSRIDCHDCKARMRPAA